jgi:23S rRNA U2552 (ribose-2'-O)-methylase RlmE/FtsJ
MGEVRALNPNRMKHFAQAASGELKRNELDPLFRTVKLIKPTSSRKESPEVYYLCRGFIGQPKEEVN